MKNSKFSPDQKLISLGSFLLPRVEKISFGRFLNQQKIEMTTFFKQQILPSIPEEVECGPQEVHEDKIVTDCYDSSVKIYMHNSKELSVNKFSEYLLGIFCLDKEDKKFHEFIKKTNIFFVRTKKGIFKITLKPLPKSHGSVLNSCAYNFNVLKNFAGTSVFSSPIEEVAQPMYVTIH